MDNKKTKPTTTAAPAKHTSIGSQRAPYARLIQNFLLVWLDGSIDEVNNNYSANTISKLREVINSIYTFNDVDECIDFTSDIKEEEILMIVSDTLAQTIMPVVQDMAQVSTVYIYCGIKSQHEQWFQQWPKMKGIFTNITFICEALKKVIQECDQNTISMSFVTTSADTKNTNLDQLDQSFMYTQILKEIILTIDFEQQHIKDFLNYCRKQFVGNTKELKNVDKLEQEYHKHVPIWWYTYPCFLFSMLNRALRMMEIDLIISMGFFIRDLDKHITQLHLEQFVGHTHSNTFIAYRGQGFSQTDFDKLVKTKGGLLSFNNFLSTSMDRQVSLNFLHQTMKNSDLVGILFIMKIDPSASSTPFANIRDISRIPGEEEILFSMHSIFRIGNIKQMDKKNNRLWQVELVLTSDNDPELQMLTEHIRKEACSQGKGWYRLGHLLIKLGQFDKAQQVFEIMHDQKPDGCNEADIYYMLGKVKNDQGKYAQAITFYEKSNEILQKILPPTHLNLAAIDNHIGTVYHKIGEYSKALSYYEKALKICRKTLPSNHPDLATSYNNIGSMYDDMGEYSKALSYYEKALEIEQKTLPSNHPGLATSYNNIGSVYDKMDEYSKALSYHEKALEIRLKTLPQNHPDLAQSYNNIGSVYDKMDEYSKALSYYEKALEIYQKTLPSNHPDLAIFYNNIGLVYNNMDEYSKAFSYHEKALKIRQETLPENHPSLATSYNNIGLVYYNMDEYSKALSYYEKALEIQQKTLPPNHTSLATSYNNIGSVYDNMGEYSKALSYFEKALKIRQKTLPENHPNLAISYSNIGSVHNSMGDYSKALSFFERALVIRRHLLPENHPDLQVYKKNIEIIKKRL